MRYVLKYFLLILVFIGSQYKARTQEFNWTVGYTGVFDNREYFNPYTDDQTIFGSRVFGYAGFSLNQNNRFAAGMSYFYEFGSKGEQLNPDIILFYKGKLNHFLLTMGAFPRYSEISLPFALLNDTISYYRPNIEGISLEYRNGSFRHNVWIDWTGRQSFDRKEAFMIGFSGIYTGKWFVYRHHVIMSHIAHTMNRNLDEHIRDNGGYTIESGFDLSSYAGLDSLTLTTGILGSWDRLRGVYEFSFPVGWISEAVINYKGLGIHGLYYTGERQVIVSGDGFYQAGHYGRVDLYYEGNRQGLSGKVRFSMHFIQDIVDLSMSLVIRAQLDGNISLGDRVMR